MKQSYLRLPQLTKKSPQHFHSRKLTYSAYSQLASCPCGHQQSNTESRKFKKFRTNCQHRTFSTHKKTVGNVPNIAHDIRNSPTAAANSTRHKRVDQKHRVKKRPEDKLEWMPSSQPSALSRRIISCRDLPTLRRVTTSLLEAGHVHQQEQSSIINCSMRKAGEFGAEGKVYAGELFTMAKEVGVVDGNCYTTMMWHLTTSASRSRSGAGVTGGMGIRKASALLDEMIATNVPPSHYTFSVLIGACAKAGAGYKGTGLKLWAAYEQMVSLTGGMVDKVKEGQSVLPVWTALLQLYTVNDDMGGALRVFEEMQTKAMLTPDAFSYCTLLKALVTDWRECERIFGHAVGVAVATSGHGLDEMPVVNEYVTQQMLHSYAHCGHVSNALYFFGKLVEANCRRGEESDEKLMSGTVWRAVEKMRRNVARSRCGEKKFLVAEKKKSDVCKKGRGGVDEDVVMETVRGSGLEIESDLDVDSSGKIDKWFEQLAVAGVRVELNAAICVTMLKAMVRAPLVKNAMVVEMDRRQAELSDKLGRNEVRQLRAQEWHVDKSSNDGKCESLIHGHKYVWTVAGMVGDVMKHFGICKSSSITYYGTLFQLCLFRYNGTNRVDIVNELYSEMKLGRDVDGKKVAVSDFELHGALLVYFSYVREHGHDVGVMQTVLDWIQSEMQAAGMTHGPASKYTCDLITQAQSYIILHGKD